MIDSHCHIDLPAFDHDRADVIASAIKQGVTRLLVPGLYINQFDTLIALQKQYACLDIAFGFHPYYLQHHCEGEVNANIQVLERYISQYRSHICAIGETGIDTVISVPLAKQIDYLQAQIELSSAFALPLILHHRKSHNEIIRLLKRNNFSQGGVVHAFSGSAEMAKNYADLGFKIGIGGTITYARANKTIKAIKSIGLAHLLLETDAPDMPLYGYQGQRNTPARLPLVADKLASILCIDTAQVVEQTNMNYRMVFKKTI